MSCYESGQAERAQTTFEFDVVDQHFVDLKLDSVDLNRKPVLNNLEPYSVIQRTLDVRFPIVDEILIRLVQYGQSMFHLVPAV